MDQACTASTSSLAGKNPFGASFERAESVVVAAPTAPPAWPTCQLHQAQVCLQETGETTGLRRGTAPRSRTDRLRSWREPFRTLEQWRRKRRWPPRLHSAWAMTPSEDTARENGVVMSSRTTKQGVIIAPGSWAEDEDTDGSLVGVIGWAGRNSMHTTTGHPRS